MINIDSIINTALDTKYQYGKSSGFPKWLSLDGTNDYGVQFPGLNGYGCSKKNDGIRDYIECRSGWVDAVGYNPPMNSKNIGLYKFVWMVEDYGVTRTFWSWQGYTTFTVNASGKIEVELQGGGGSIRITSNNTVTIGSIVCCVIRINTNDTGGTRNVNDADIWISSTKETKGSTAIGANTSIGSYGLWGSYNTTPTSPWYGRLYRATFWKDITPSDTDCANEQASPWADILPNPTVELTPNNVGNRFPGNTSYRDAFVRGLREPGTDADGRYAEFWANYDRNVLKGFSSGLQTTSNILLTQADSFILKSKFKITQFQANNNMGIFGAKFNCCFYLDNLYRLQAGCRTSTTVASIVALNTVDLNRAYNCTLRWSAVDKKMYFYVDGVCVNPAGMSFPTTFSISTNVCFGWSAIIGGDESSGRIRMYHARIAVGDFTDADILADHNAQNTLPQDERIILERRPEGLKNQPMFFRENNLSGPGWSAAGATVTPNFGTFLDGTPTSRITSTAGAGFNVSRTITSFGGIAVNGAWMASKTLYRKTWLRTRPGASTSQKVRLTIRQNPVQDFIQSDITVNDVWQEFSHTATMNSSGSGTSLQMRIVSATTLEAVDIEVAYTIGRVGNEWCMDYSLDCKPSCLGRFEPITVSLNIKPGRDGTNVSNSEISLRFPWHQLHLRGSTNSIQRRSDSQGGARIQSYTLGSGFRNPIHLTCTRYIDPITNFTKMELFVDGVPTTYNQTMQNLFPEQSISSSTLLIGNNGSPYTMQKLRDIKILKGKAGQAEAQQLKNGITPNNMNLYAWYGPGNSEAGNTVRLDQSGNNRHIKLVNGAQIDYQQII